MTATLILGVICVGGSAFLIRFLIAMFNEVGGRKCRVERILPHSVIDWGVDIK